MQTGLPLVITAPSGTGKSTLIKMLMAEFPQFQFSVSCTTRKPREGEIEGKDYYFLDEAEFMQRRKNNFFAEWAQVHTSYYGTPLEEIERNLSCGNDLIFDIDIQGARQLFLTLPRAFFVFLFPPSLEILESRLKNRKTEKEWEIERRLHNAKDEIIQSHWFNAWIINDTLDKAYADLKACVLAAKCQPLRQNDLINKLIYDN